MAKIYESDDYFFEMKRTYPKIGLPIKNKHTHESLFSLYEHVDHKSLYLSYSFISRLKKNEQLKIAESRCMETPFKEFEQILFLARKHALENNRNLFLKYNMSLHFNVQNFVLSHLNENIVVPMTNNEIEIVNQSGSIVNLKIPSDIDMNVHVTRTQTLCEEFWFNEKLISILPIVSTGKINLDINSSVNNKILYLKSEHNDYSNIILLTDSGEIKNNEVDFDTNYNGRLTEQIFKSPQTINNRIKSKIRFLCNQYSIYDSKTQANHKTYMYYVPKYFQIHPKNIILLEGNILKCSIELMDILSRKHKYDKEQSELIEAIDNIINLYEAYPLNFGERDAEDKFKQLKNLRNSIKIKHDELSHS